MKKVSSLYSTLRMFFDPSIEGSPFRAYEKRKAYFTFGVKYKRTMIVGR
jgi:hypothetical protein